MRSCAFKTASHNPELKNLLPDNFITEWTYVDLHPAGEIKESDGWQFEDDSTFLIKADRNHLLLQKDN